MKHNICPTCKARGEYSFRFDTFFCGKCNIWLDQTCPATDDCIYCSDRPTTPASYYLRRIETYSTIKGVLYSLEHFRSLVVAEAILPEDGLVESIFIDGVHDNTLALSGWCLSSYGELADTLTKKIKLDDLDKIYPNQTIQLEWCANGTKI